MGFNLIENATLKSSRANNEAKIVRFKNIIKNQIIQRTEYDYVEKFLNVAEQLTDKQVLVLKGFVETMRPLYKYRRFNEMARIQIEGIKIQQYEKGYLSGHGKSEEELWKDRSDIENSVLNNEREIEKLFDKRSMTLKIFLEEEFHFMLAELVSLGLLYNPSQGKASDTGEPEHLSPTTLARQFIDYLKD